MENNHNHNSTQLASAPLFAPSMSIHRNRKLACLDERGNVEKIFLTTMDAAKAIEAQTGIPWEKARSAIYAANGTDRIYCGYKWKYATDVVFKQKTG